jgi:hypothetical protein
VGARAAAEVERAARLVLGRELGPGVRRAELRRAFRRRALEIHPDRAAALGQDARALADEFMALCSAFELLDGLAAADEAAGRRAPRPAPARPLPPRPLRFAEYLYYCGRIAWAELAQALAWRRRDPRRIGRWFVERGILAEAELGAVDEALARHNAGWRT